MSQQWEEANRWEEQWNSQCINWLGEEQKQLTYAKRMGLKMFSTEQSHYNYDLQGKSVLDIGGGPSSILLKCHNGGKRMVIDPVKMPDWVIQRYGEAGIVFMNLKGEEIDSHLHKQRFDEVWLYNVLQHTEDPKKIIENAFKLGKVVRVFEWIETEVNIGHPHSFTESQLNDLFGGRGTVEELNGENQCYGKCWYGVFPKAVEPKPDHYRFHVVALPHTITSKEYVACAYTQKVYKFCKMMLDLGHEVYHYGTQGSDVPCTEHITVITKEEQMKLLGQTDWKQKMFKITWDPNVSYWKLANERAAKEINKRKQKKDFVCLIGGNCQKPIADQVGNDVQVVEYGIGYNWGGTFAPFRVFESYSHMHMSYGVRSGGDGGDGVYYDAVIPNYFDPNDFAIADKKEDYYLYLGRLISRKGIDIAVETTRRLGAKLLIAGQGVEKIEGNRITNEEGIVFEGDHIEHVGYADVERRKELMSKAKAVFVPTKYIEPFGGVAVEAQMCGTPVITTDWGAFTETVQHGVTGYRCRTLEQFIWAAKNADKLDPQKIREWAVNNYSLDRISKMYQEYFDMLYDLWDEGWYQLKERENLDWLIKKY